MSVVAAYGEVQVERNATRMLPRGDFNGHDGAWFPTRAVRLTERGAVVRLSRRERATFDGQTWDGLDVRWVELRRWHDGSVTVERTVERMTH